MSLADKERNFGVQSSHSITWAEVSSWAAKSITAQPLLWTARLTWFANIALAFLTAVISTAFGVFRTALCSFVPWTASGSFVAAYGICFAAVLGTRTAVIPAASIRLLAELRGGSIAAVVVCWGTKLTTGHPMS